MIAHAVIEAAAQASKKAAETNGRVCLIMVETPANPTNSLVDLEADARSLGDDRRAPERRPAAGGGRQHISRAGVSSVRSASASTSSCIR